MHARIPQLALGGACKKPRTAKEEIEKKRQINNWKEKGEKKKKSMTKGSRIKVKEVETQEHP